MKPLRLLFCFLFLSAQIWGNNKRITESVLIHADIVQNGVQLNLVSYTKGQDYIRASIFDDEKIATVDVIFRDGKMGLVENLNGVRSERLLSGDDAAGNLLDLLALNPSFHFKRYDGFDTDVELLEDFSIVYEMTIPEPNSDKEPHPKSLKLFKIEAEEKILIREIAFDSFFNEKSGQRQPKKLLLIDATTGDSGQLIVRSVEHNVGIPDFLFELEVPE